ncbi:hypothetical protein SAMN04488047_11521 [Tranquillimonas alkanivorans]|uniref:Uncharacterized protein n=2 Tax=Tranquillimonas alkanivorans TaxID=441119 RepID=A0A1I5TTI8_9RHOB|nr:hypothetical protein SAMN04488047_11521 [Tranquillimonas alkanivorans]
MRSYEEIRDERRQRLGLSPWEDLRQAYLENSIYLGAEAPRNCQEIEKNSDHMLVNRILLDLGLERVRKEGLDPDSCEALEILDEAHGIASDITGAFFQAVSAAQRRGAELEVAEARRAFSMRFRGEPRWFLSEVKKHGELQVDRDGLEYAVGRYLDSPYRDLQVDRLLVQALSDMEITAYVEEQVRPNPFPGRSRLQVQRASLLVGWLKVSAKAAGVLALYLVGLVGLYALVPNLPAAWLIAAGLAGGVIYLLFTLAVLVSAIRAGPKWRRMRETTETLIDKMTSFHVEMRGSGPISVRYLRDRMQQLTEAGVIWPQSLWSLLDDLEARAVARI